MKISFFLSILSCFILSSIVQAANPPEPLVASQSAKPVHQINLNTADAKMLSKSMKGIGIKRAQAIVKYRETHGAFKSINDLSQVPGLGKNFVATHLNELQEIFIL
ncbi:MAG: helix-hairpin-helix domain-containing protein [Legionella sp.]|nr:helix-hairpin-helix domain-containing protein [Legionella sp.]